MKTSLEILTQKLEIYYENIYQLLKAFQEATNNRATATTINVPIRKFGSNQIEYVQVNSFQKLQREIKKIENNFQSLTNSNNISYILNGDGTLTQFTRTTFMNAQFIDTDTISFDGNQCIVENNAIIEDLLYPIVKLPIQIADDLLGADIYVRTFDVTYGWDNIVTRDNEKKSTSDKGITILDMEQLFNVGKLRYNEVTRLIPQEKQQVYYFGRFMIEDIQVIDTGLYKVKLGSLKYHSLNTVGMAVDLTVEDELVHPDGTSRFLVIELDTFNSTVVLQKIAGDNRTPTKGIELIYNQSMPATSNQVNVPIKPAKKLVIFLSSVNNQNISFPSTGILIDTETYQVIYKQTTYTIDEFFSKYVVNFSEYLSAMLSSATIPYSLGVKIPKPKLDPINFRVIQINKHLTDGKTKNEIDRLNKNKQSVQNDIDYKQSQITKLEGDIETQKFKSTEEYEHITKRISQLRSDVNLLKANLLTITRDIDANTIKSGIKSQKPKYRVIGFWELQEPLYSNYTKAQNIITYEVQYRYLSRDLDTIENTSYTMILDGKEVSVAFSGWNTAQTKTLNKVESIDGSLQWEQISPDSIDEININQCSISINAAESIEIRVRAISEAGYPLSPVKSDWSDLLRVDFPEDLRDDNLQTTIDKNAIDLQNAEFDNIIQKYGLLKHISDAIKESERDFMHHASNIASGQFTVEQKNIPVSTVLQTLLNRVTLLENAEASKILVYVVDFNGNSFQVMENSTIDLFGGNYTDDLNILDNTIWGTIITKKFYIKLENSSGNPIELRSLIPGAPTPSGTELDVLSSSEAPEYYDTPVRIGSVHQRQEHGQIIYFRNTDISNANTELAKLVKSDTTEGAGKANITAGSGAGLKDVWYLTTGAAAQRATVLPTSYDEGSGGVNVNIISYLDTVALTAALAGEPILNHLKRVKYFNSMIYAERWQNSNPEILKSKYGFGYIDEIDRYLIGKYTCGAFLYPSIADERSIKVNGTNTASSFIIPKESNALIPIVWQYRMTDAIGNSYEKTQGLSKYDIEYTKTLGVDIQITNTKVFKFDIRITSRMKSKQTIKDTMNINPILQQFTNEAKEILT
jgi:hypothetical protein